MKFFTVIVPLVLLIGLNVLVSREMLCEKDTGLIFKAVSDSGVKNTDVCMKWAFGKDWRALASNKFDDAWNREHPELKKIYAFDEAGAVIKMVAKHCLENKI